MANQLIFNKVIALAGFQNQNGYTKNNKLNASFMSPKKSDTVLNFTRNFGTLGNWSERGSMALSAANDQNGSSNGFSPFPSFLPDPLSFLQEFREPQALSQGYQLEDSWVLKPKGLAKGVIHFLGGAFVGASPQVAYALLIEELAEQGYIVISTPYDLTFNHAACALRTAESLDRCLSQLCIVPAGSNGQTGEDLEAFQQLPLYCVGHSNGSLLHLLASSLPECQHTSYSAVQSMCLMSFNNKPVEEAVPGGVPDAVSPIASQAYQVGSTLSPQLSQLQAMFPTPDLAKPLLPFINQLVPAGQELAEGAQEFTPSPEQSREIILQGYSVPKTLLVRFADDSFDETASVQEVLLQAGTDQLIVQVEDITGLGHLTPLGGIVDWDASEVFNPLDAIGQALKQDTVKRVRGLADKITPFLAPF